MTAQLPSKVRLAQIASFSKSMALPPSHDEIEAMARALLAAHEQEPVAWKATHLDSFAFGETKSAVEEHADRFGWELEFTEITPLYTHPAPVPTVLDYYVVVTSANVWQTFCKTRAEADFIVSKLFHKGYYVLEVYTRRAAMLNGGKS